MKYKLSAPELSKLYLVLKHGDETHCRWLRDALHAWNENKPMQACDPLAKDPVPLILTCPSCGARHVDKGVFATKPHHTHACQGCGMTWRPALVDTVGVQFLPGYKDEP